MTKKDDHPITAIGKGTFGKDVPIRVFDYINKGKLIGVALKIGEGYTTRWIFLRSADAHNLSRRIMKC